MPFVLDHVRVTHPTPGGGRLTALDDVSLTVERGETLGVVGESGAGKSTLVRLLLGFQAPDSGTVRFDRIPLPAPDRDQERAFRRQVQPVFQDPASSLDPLQTVESALGEAIGIAGLDDRNGRIDRLLTSIGLESSVRTRRPHQLSAGQKQRVCIARALSVEPQVLLLDEPVSALDLSVQAQILNLLTELKAARGLTYLFVSHDLDVVAHLAQRVAVLSKGQLVELGPTRAVLERPQHPYTRSLIAAAHARQETRDPKVR